MAAQNGSLMLIGRSGRTYNIDFYAPDATGTVLTFNTTGAAASTSPAFFRAPEDCVLADISLASAPTATQVTFQRNSGAIAGGALRWANQLTSVAYRPKINMPFAAGDFISAVQA